MASNDSFMLFLLMLNSNTPFNQIEIYISTLPSLSHVTLPSLPDRREGREGRVTRGREGRVARGREGRVTPEREGMVKRGKTIYDLKMHF